MCVGAILQARITRLVYGATDRKAGAISSICQWEQLSHNHEITVTAGILAEHCGNLLSEFFLTRRKNSTED